MKSLLCTIPMLSLAACNTRSVGDCGLAGVGDCGITRVGDCGITRVGDCGLTRVGDSGIPHVGDCGITRVSDGGITRASDGGARDLATPSIACDLATPSIARDLSAALDPAATFVMTLDAGAFPPGPHPSVLVYVPSRFDPTPPIAIVVYLHGFNNCVENVVRDAGRPCTPSGPTRSAYSLVAQLEASGKNAILVCPELLYDQAAGNPGTLGATNGWRALLTETLAHLAGPLRNATIADVGTVVVASHSGGYTAAMGLIDRGGVPVSELYMLDSLYDSNAAVDFDPWVARLGPGHRYGDVYTQGGGTLGNSQAQATRMSRLVAGDMGLILDDRTADTLPDSAYAHSLIFKYTALAHDAVPTYYFGKFVATSSLPDKR
jgi:hypothetical protein